MKFPIKVALTVQVLGLVLANYWSFLHHDVTACETGESLHTDDNNVTECKSCGEGTYKKDVGTHTCSDCPDETPHTIGSGKSEQSDCVLICPSGKHPFRGKCKSCPSYTVKIWHGKQGCRNVKRGEKVNPDRSSYECDIGYEYVFSEEACLPCLKGFDRDNLHQSQCLLVNDDVDYSKYYEPKEKPFKTRKKKAIIIGVAVGIMCLAIIVATILICYIKWRQRKKKAKEEIEKRSPPLNPPKVSSIWQVPMPVRPKGEKIHGIHGYRSQIDRKSTRRPSQIDGKSSRRPSHMSSAMSVKSFNYDSDDSDSSDYDSDSSSYVSRSNSRVNIQKQHVPARRMSSRYIEERGRSSRGGPSVSDSRRRSRVGAKRSNIRGMPQSSTSLANRKNSSGLRTSRSDIRVGPVQSSERPRRMKRYSRRRRSPSSSDSSDDDVRLDTTRKNRRKDSLVSIGMGLGF